MSYFMTISGELPPGNFSPVEFLLISQGQKYVAALEAELSSADGAPMWLIHDGRTGTSDFVIDAQTHFSEYRTFEGTLLYRLMSACVKVGCTFRIWWASGPDCHWDVEEFSSFDALCSGMAQMHEIGVRWTNPEA